MQLPRPYRYYCTVGTMHHNTCCAFMFQIKVFSTSGEYSHSLLLLLLWCTLDMVDSILHKRLIFLCDHNTNLFTCIEACVWVHMDAHAWLLNCLLVSNHHASLTCKRTAHACLTDIEVTEPERVHNDLWICFWHPRSLFIFFKRPFTCHVRHGQFWICFPSNYAISENNLSKLV